MRTLENDNIFFVSSVGLRLLPEQFGPFLHDYILPNSEEIKAAEWTYRVFRDISGAQIWLAQREEEAFFHPFYDGKSRLKVNLTEKYDMSGHFYGWVNPRGEQQGDFPVLFLSPDFFLHQNIKLPATVDVNIIGLVRAIDFYNPAAQNPEFPLAEKSYIPLGLFGEAQGETALITGEVIDFEEKTNSLTGHSFYWILIKSAFDTEFDLLADGRFFSPGELETGKILQAEVMQLGKIIE